MTNHLFFPAHQAAGTSLIGGKGANLHRLQRSGHNVPAWFAVTTDCFREVLTEARLLEGIEALTAGIGLETELGALSAEIRDAVTKLDLPPELIDAIAKGCAEIAGEGFVAVRSSAVDEDSGGASFAGLHESFLFVRGQEALSRALLGVWCSAYSERALSYRRESGLPLTGISISVVMQKMVGASASGVLFTANPNSGNTRQLVVSSLWGMGEGLVSAGLDADVFTLSKFSNEMDTVLGEKRTQLLLDEESGGGLVEREVLESMVTAPSLSGTMLAELKEIGLKIENQYRVPMDVEFAYDDSVLYVLQARPITTLAEDGPAAGNRTVWDNSNIIESYSGVTSPMTFSFIRHAYTVVYHCFSRVMGIRPETVKRNRHVFSNMLGLFQGQVYYNLVNWYRVIQQFPGYNLNKRFMESMMGLKERFDPEDGETTGSVGWKDRVVGALELATLLAKMAWRFKHIDQRVERFDSHFRTHHAKWEALDFEEQTPAQLMAIYREMEEELLWRWDTPIVNDFFVMVFYGLLKKICTSWCGDGSGSLQNDLICGNGDIESTEPTRMLMRLALRIRHDGEVLALFEAHTPSELVSLTEKEQALADVRSSVAEYLRLYGFRCVNELKLEEPSLRETPEFIYQILKNYLRLDEGALDVRAMEAREREIRAKAEKVALETLARKALSNLRQKAFLRVLANARKGVRNRENMRFSRTRIYGTLRELLNATGGHLAEAALIDSPKDIYFLTIDEVWDYVQGTAVTTNLRGLVELRRAEFGRYREMDPPDDHFETYGMAYHRNLFRDHTATTVAAEGALAGIGCCPGEVTGPVKIVNSPKDDLDLNGFILVAARTDPGWVPLYPAVRGILIERGSILSHSAIVAREMGIPTIVGIPNLMLAIQDGQTVTMNGETGTIHPA